MLLMPSPKSTPPNTLSALNHRLQQAFASMTPQFQIGARFLLDHPRAVSLYSMRHIAREAGVQPASLVLLDQSLDFSGWQAITQVFIEHLLYTHDTYTYRARSLINSSSDLDVIQQTY